LQRRHYSQATIADVAEALKAQKMFSSREWKRLYSDGAVVKWLQQVSDFFMADAGATGSIPARDYFDPTLYLGTIS
jgi:NitT/TauT family transport system substrate-binding protein